MDQNDNEQDTHRSVSRRAVVGAATWIVPAIALALSSPVASASGTTCFEAGSITTSFSSEPVSPTPPPTGTAPRDPSGTKYSYQVDPVTYAGPGLFIESTVQICNTGTLPVDPASLVVSTLGSNWSDWRQVGDMQVTITGSGGTRTATVTGTPVAGSESHPIGRTSWNMASASATLGLIAVGECITFIWTMEAMAVSSSPNAFSSTNPLTPRQYFDSQSTGSGYFYPNFSVRCGSWSDTLSARDSGNVYQWVH